jgi:hypothetical protein
MSEVFISYRREESAYVADRISEEIRQRFGRDSVFLDVDNIPYGIDFRTHIIEASERTDLLIVIIGNNWINMFGRYGAINTDKTKDFVLIEIEMALKKKIPIIPVLIEDATMPGEKAYLNP